MTIKKQFPSGAWEVSDIIEGYYVRRVYFGYTKAEARAEFREEFLKKAKK